MFERSGREHGAHPSAVKLGLADTFWLYLETTATWVRRKGRAPGSGNHTARRPGRQR